MSKVNSIGYIENRSYNNAKEHSEVLRLWIPAYAGMTLLLVLLFYNITGHNAILLYKKISSTHYIILSYKDSTHWRT
jgi:hypothetical protein